MAWPDIVNGMFEIGGAIACLGHIKQILKDKKVAGVFIPAVIFFSSWGYWNIFYYWHLNQWVSWLAGIVLAICNSYWAYLLWYYSKHGKKET